MSKIGDIRRAAGFGGVEGVARLAKLVRRSPGWVRAVEAGYRPPEESARRLAACLGCDPKTFLGGGTNLRGGRAVKAPAFTKRSGRS